MARKSSLVPSSISSASRQSSLAYKGCAEPLNDAALQFKLSKKVAELTLVVHMLFTRNHEREVELESTQSAYELEISRIVKHQSTEVLRLKTELEAEKLNKIERIDQLTKENEIEVKNMSQKMNKKISDLEREIEKYKKRSSAFEERYSLLEDENKRIQKEYDYVLKERTAKEKAMEKDHLKIEKLQQQARANKELMEKMKDTIHSMQKSVNHKISQLESNNRASNELAENLKLHNELLESDNRNLKKKVADQANMIKRLEFNPNPPNCASVSTAKSKSSLKSAKSLDQDEEIERLKRELQKYRLELTNRENNFNKIFSEIKPVMVNNGVLNELRNCPSQRSQRSGIPSATTSDQISMYQYKQTSHIQSTERLRNKSKRTSLPSVFFSSQRCPRPSTHGEPGESLHPFNNTPADVRSSVPVKPGTVKQREAKTSWDLSRKWGVL